MLVQSERSCALVYVSDQTNIKVMHNIKTNFDRVYCICKQFIESEVDSNGNFQYYSRRPELSDVQIVL